jgi:hypothetical protein
MPFRVHPKYLNNIIRFSTSQSHPFHASLARPGDHPFSVAGGFIQSDLAFLTYQLNDRNYREFAPSLMLRSFLAEYFINVGIRHIAFVGGCSGLLAHQCIPVPAVKLLLVRKTIAARVKQLTLVMGAGVNHLIARQSSRLIGLTKAGLAQVVSVPLLVTAGLAPAIQWIGGAGSQVANLGGWVNLLPICSG